MYVYQNQFCSPFNVVEVIFPIFYDDQHKSTPIQKHLCKLRKQKKFTDKEYFEIYPSDPIPPQLYGTVKAHKPEKNYPMHTVVSTIRTPPYVTSKYLVKIIQPTLNNSQHKIKKSVEFVNEAKTWKIFPIEIQVSYVVVNLYPSVPFDKAIDVIVKYLKNDFSNVKIRTKLTLVDIHQLIELWVNECYFLYNLEPNQRLEEKSMDLSFALNISPETFKRYVDDSHTSLKINKNLFSFLKS